VTKRLVVVAGCDDETEAAVDLTPNEYAALRRVAAATVEASEYGCQPILQVFPGEER
jgi:hypothetical protein